MKYYLRPPKAAWYQQLWLLRAALIVNILLGVYLYVREFENMVMGVWQ